MSDIDREQLGEWLSAYLDGELSEEQTTVVERLLREDASARQSLDALRRASELVSSLPRHAAPDSIAEDVQAHAERQGLLGGMETPSSIGQPRRSPIRAALSLAAMLAFVVGGLWFIAVYNRSEGEPRTDVVAAASKRRMPAPAARVEASKGDRDDAKGEASTAAERLAVAASFDQKLRAGMSLAAVHTHAFDNEPVRLQVTVSDGRRRDALEARLVAYLGGRQSTDLASVAGAKAEGSVLPGSFYFRGTSGRNFDQPSQRQILVSASRSELDIMVAELGRATVKGESVALRAGPLSIRGWRRVQTALYGIEDTATGVDLEEGDTAWTSSAVADSASGSGSSSKVVEANRGVLDGLAKIMGLAPESPALIGSSSAADAGPAESSAASHDARALSGGPTASTAQSPQDAEVTVAREDSVLAEARTAALHAKPAKLNRRRAGGRPERAGRSSLVSRRMRELEGVTARRAARKTMPARPEARVTLIVQFIPPRQDPPRSTRPAAKTKTPVKKKRGGTEPVE